MLSNKNIALIYIGVIAAVSIAITIGFLAFNRPNKTSREMTEEKAIKKLESMIKEIGPKEGTPTSGTLVYEDEDRTFQELPDLTDSSIVVRENTQRYVEIFASSEKTGTGNNSFLRQKAEEFNAARNEIDGERVSIRLRTVSSGQQIDYVSSGKAIPDAISPSSDLVVKMLEANNVDYTYVSDSVVMNYAGICISSKAYTVLVEEYSGADIHNLIKAVIDGKIKLGYTNPFQSATGFNMLAVILEEFDSADVLSSRAVTGFKSFQQNIPFVAMTTTQMKTASTKGVLDAFCMEYQDYLGDSTLSKNYKFIPFGYAHNNPLVAVGSQDATKMAILREFAEFCAQDTKYAEQCGFNKVPSGYVNHGDVSYKGATLASMQQLYKEHKDSKPVVAVFVVDLSDSMAGASINSLKDALVNSMSYINSDNYIGIVSYNSKVTIELPIDKFDFDQQCLFKGTVESFTTNGMTAMCDGAMVAVDMIQKKLIDIPDARPIIFLLSDGERNVGYRVSECEDIIQTLSIPIYTINYNMNVTNDMKAISDINEGVSINATSDDVIYQLKQLFNANM